MKILNIVPIGHQWGIILDVEDIMQPVLGLTERCVTLYTDTELNEIKRTAVKDALASLTRYMNQEHPEKKA